jgi:hypothetical protein
MVQQLLDVIDAFHVIVRPLRCLEESVRCPRFGDVSAASFKVLQR